MTMKVKPRGVSRRLCCRGVCCPLFETLTLLDISHQCPCLVAENWSVRSHLSSCPPQPLSNLVRKMRDPGNEVEHLS